MQSLLNKAAEIFKNNLVFFCLYMLFVLPTYYLPYVGSNSSVLNALGAAVGLGLSPQFWTHVACLFVLLIITWLRGCSINKQWIAVFPAIGGIFDMTPGLNLIPLLPTAMHLCALIMGVRGSTQPVESIKVPFTGAILATVGGAIVVSGLLYSWAWPSRLQTISQDSKIEARRHNAIQNQSSQKKPSVESTQSSSKIDDPLKLFGQWYDGGGGCASIKQGKNPRDYELKTWYCEADEAIAKPIVLNYDRTVKGYVDEVSGLMLNIQSDGRLKISANEEVRSRLGEGAFLADNVTVFYRVLS